jgi:hypothetical protein
MMTPSLNAIYSTVIGSFVFHPRAACLTNSPLRLLYLRSSQTLLLMLALYPEAATFPTVERNNLVILTLQTLTILRHHDTLSQLSDLCLTIR